MACNTLKYNMWLYRNIILIIVVPLVFIPVLFIGHFANNELPTPKLDPHQKYRCIYCICVIAVFWFTKALPLAITSFLPLVLFPLFGILDTKKVAESYITDSNIMFIGGLMMAIAIETCGLHYRIALRMISIAGSSQTRLLLGMMITAAFCSMWITNTGTTAMMAPIALVLVDELSKDTSKEKYSKDKVPTAPVQEIEILESNGLPSSKLNLGIFSVSFANDIIPEKTAKGQLQLKKLYLIALCYAAKIGGNGTITGSAPQLIFRELISQVDISQNGTNLNLTFSTWMALNIPAAILTLFVTWAYLCIAFIGLPKKKNLFNCFKKSSSAVETEEKAKTDKAFNKIIQDKQKELGSLTFPEGIVAILFLTIVTLWLTRDVLWVQLFHPTVVSDSTSLIGIISLMFVIPKDFNDFSKGTILEWKYVQSKLAWDTVILIGSGFAISKACISSGLSDAIGDAMYHLQELPGWVIMTLVMLIVTFATEFISNNACASIFLPVLISMSKSLDLHPLYLTVPAAVACSYAFMLPSGSPSNALIMAASNGDIKILDMVKSGFLLNFLCAFAFVLVNVTYGNLLFDYNDFIYSNN